MPTTTLNRVRLTQIIRTAIENSESPDRGADFIDQVMSTIDPSDYETYLREALKRVVPVIDNEVRRDSIQHVFTPPRPTRGLTKGDMLRSRYWPAFLHQSLPTETGRKVLGFATAVDLDYAANVRTAQAEKNLEEASKYQRLASLLRLNDVNTLAELDITLIESIFVS